MIVKAYLEITLFIEGDNRPAAAKIFSKYKEPFLNQIDGAVTKNLLIRSEDVQVSHGFTDEQAANDYLKTELFKNDVAAGLQPMWFKEPEIKVYSVF
jgi:hypothetical protein